MALLLNERGRALTYSALDNRYDRARVKARAAHPELADEIRQAQFRDLRAKAGTDIDEERGMKAAQELLGHTTEAMTRQYVRHRLGKKVEPTR